MRGKVDRGNQRFFIIVQKCVSLCRFYGDAYCEMYVVSVCWVLRCAGGIKIALISVVWIYFLKFQAKV
jgi:hypothetical protein